VPLSGDPLRILFLDMDGVLNSAEFFDRREHPSLDRCSDEWWAQMVDPDAVARLNEILDATGAKVVISSSWRDHVAPDQMQRVLEVKGFRGSVIGRTPLMEEMGWENGRYGGRGLEIEAWLTENRRLEIKSFVVLDDNADMDSTSGHVMPRLVQTSWKHGLLDEHIQQAIELLTQA
jgi:hypothetical protein